MYNDVVTIKIRNFRDIKGVYLTMIKFFNIFLVDAMKCMILSSANNPFF